VFVTGCWWVLMMEEDGKTEFQKGGGFLCARRIPPFGRILDFRHSPASPKCMCACVRVCVCFSWRKSERKRKGRRLEEGGPGRWTVCGCLLPSPRAKR